MVIFANGDRSNQLALLSQSGNFYCGESSEQNTDRRIKALMKRLLRIEHFSPKPIQNQLTTAMTPPLRLDTCTLWDCRNAIKILHAIEGEDN